MAVRGSPGLERRREAAEDAAIRRPEPEPPAAGVLELQRTLGNRAVVALLQRQATAERELDARWTVKPSSIDKALADKLLSKLDAATGDAIRNKSLDAQNYGVQRQAELRGAADGEGFVEEYLWTGIGRARSGCGSAIVGDPDQVLAKLQAYREAGIDAFILSGYPHIAECDLFARHVLPRIEHAPL